MTPWNEHVAGFKQVRKAREDPEMEWKLRLSKKKRARRGWRGGYCGGAEGTGTGSVQGCKEEAQGCVL